MTEVYGTIPWAFMVRSALPLMIFFRFHAIDVIGKLWAEVYYQEDCEDEESCEKSLEALEKLPNLPYDRRLSVVDHRRSMISQMTFLLH